MGRIDHTDGLSPYLLKLRFQGRNVPLPAAGVKPEQFEARDDIKAGAVLEGVEK
jgi:hypothetical protein